MSGDDFGVSGRDFLGYRENFGLSGSGLGSQRNFGVPGWILGVPGWILGPLGGFWGVLVGFLRSLGGFWGV